MVMFGRWVVWVGIGLVLGGTFCWFTVVLTGLVERGYDGIGLVWGISG